MSEIVNVSTAVLEKEFNRVLKVAFDQGVIEGIVQGMQFERKTIIEILDNASDSNEGLYKLTQYLIRTQLEEKKND